MGREVVGWNVCGYVPGSGLCKKCGNVPGLMWVAEHLDQISNCVHTLFEKDSARLFVE
jgi:hypothetical protein